MRFNLTEDLSKLLLTSRSIQEDRSNRHIKENYKFTRMAGLSFDQINSAKKNLRKAPPPKVPLGTTASQNGDFSSDAGNVSVAAFRNRFEQKQSPTSNGQFGSPSRLSGDDRSSGENITSPRAKFEKFEPKSAKKPPPPRKPPIGAKSSKMLRRLDDNSNALKGEPNRKELPLFNRIGAAPHKKHKPANLKFKLDKYKDKIVQSNGTNHTDRGCNEEEDQDIYDDVESTLRGDLDYQPEETYECV
ncbi:unnamed protein product [Porites lobata]|uniref:Uncharacterized protein n=1 Tax=Porites lobata TaxID=104759 RepID=A0ABN8MXN7_9CNID|nr:unnamed protein product [Porites lobata]